MRLKVTLEYDIEKLSNGNLRAIDRFGLSIVNSATSEEELIERVITLMDKQRAAETDASTYEPWIPPACGNDTRGWSPSFSENCELDDGGMCIHCKWEIPF